MIDILSELMDQVIVDRNGERCGRVDDIVVEDVYDRPARVVALLAGGGAKSRQLGKWAHRLSVWLHRLLGVPPPIEPAYIPWSAVARVETDVTLKASADEAGLERVNEAVRRRFIGRIPGANR
jgi:sporulation protein YlmC with PRC-barrel domain